MSWSQESERFMCHMSNAEVRSAACVIAARLTNSYHPKFNFNLGMAYYGLAYSIDLHQGQELTIYARGVISYYDRIRQ